MSTIVHTFEQEALVAGLSWSVLRTDGDEQKSHQDGKKIRRQAALLGASAYCQQVANQALYLGLYSAGLLQKNKNRKKLYSLALAFLASFEANQQKTLNAILLMPLEQDETRKVLVVIEAGQVVHDKIERVIDAQQVIEKYRQQVGMNFHIFTADALLPQSKQVAWKDLQQHCQKWSQLKPLPKNKTAISIVVVLAIVALASFFYYQLVWQKQKQQTLLQQQNQLNNHTPKYLSELEKNLNQLAWTNQQLTLLTNAIEQEKSYLNGWALTTIVCSFANQECQYSYQRIGGKTQDMVDWALTQHKQYSIESSQQDVLVLSQNIATNTAYLQLKPPQIPPLRSSQIELHSVFQQLLNAQLQVAIGQPLVWPHQGIDLNKVDAKAKVLQTPIEIKLPWALKQSTLSLIPAYIAWRELRLQVSHDAHNSQQLTLTLKGHSYVQAH